MPLTDTQIKALKPETKPRKVANEKGLYLPVQSTGGKLWRLKYRIDGKEKLLALEVYPDVGLKDACKKRNQARRLLADGIAPGEHLKARTILHEELGVDRDVIEHQLAHAMPAPLGIAYNGTKFVKDRRRMIDLWAKCLRAFPQRSICNCAVNAKFKMNSWGIGIAYG